MSKKPIAARFWSLANKDDGCWEWQGNKVKGYGRFNDGANRSALAHRTAWFLAHGEIPANACVLHKCDNPGCVNPDHLFLGTQKDNMADRDAKGRQSKGEENGSSKLKTSDILDIRRISKTIKAKVIAEMYGISQRHTYRILEGTRWARP